MTRSGLLASLLALPALAESRPEVRGTDCPAILTVQSADCTVSVIRHCPGEATGATTTVTYGPDGYLFAGAVDGQGAWIESHDAGDGAFERTLPDPTDPISLDDLLERGLDTFDFRISRSEGGTSRELRVIGTDFLTGRRTAIDGLPLAVVATELRILESDGSIFYQTRGEQYVSPDMRLWFLGIDAVPGDDGSVATYDSRPVDFLFPGEAGFADTTPLYGCTGATPPAPKPPTPPKPPAPAGPGINTDK